MNNLYKALIVFFNLLRMGIVTRVLLIILDVNSINIFTVFIYRITEPLFKLATKILDKIKLDTGVLDFTPFVAMFLVELLEYLVRRVL